MLAFGVLPACANDSSAAIAAGGLKPIKNDQVRMVSEVLRITPRLVEVDYVFENTGGADITTQVAFPLPDLDQAVAYNSPLNIPFANKANFIGFEVWIDGRDVRPDVEVRAFVNNAEITAELKRLGVDPVSPGVDNPKAVSSDVIEALRRLDAISKDEHNAFAMWTTKVSFHWSQTFPAGKRVAVRHRYRPIHGNFYHPIDPKEPRTKFVNAENPFGKEWCFDAGFATALARLFDRQYDAATRSSNPADDFTVWYDSVQYVLKTGANWQGPIGRFELQIDKGGADLISTCPIPGLRLQRTSYGFNAVANDYTPVSDLDILFVSDRFLGRADDPPLEGK